MLLESKRKRKRSAIGAFTAAEIPQHPPRRAAPAAVPAHSEPSPHAPATRFPVGPTPRTARGDEEEKRDEHTDTAALGAARPGPSTGGAWLARAVPLPRPSTHAVAAPSAVVVDRRVLLSRASRVQLLLLERLRCVDIRRSRRGELLEDIRRLKQVMKQLQDEVDATTRSLENLESLVQQLQRISFVYEPTPTPTAATSTTLRGLLAAGTMSGDAAAAAAVARHHQHRRAEAREEQSVRGAGPPRLGREPRAAVDSSSMGRGTVLWTNPDLRDLRDAAAPRKP